MPPDYFKWNYVNQMKLLSLLRLHPVLWDSSLSTYTNKNERYIALESIASQMDTTRDIIKRKIHTLRSQYTKENRLIRQNPNYKPKWKMFEDVKFLYKHDKLQNIENDIDDEDDESSKNLDLIDIKDVTFSSEDYGRDFDGSSENIWSMTAEDYEGTYKENENTDVLITNCHKRQHAASRQKTQLTTNSKIDKNHCKTSLEIPRVQSVRDEFMVFGENVANELRLLKDFKPIQLALKCKILRAILEANEALHRAGWFSLRL